MNCLRGFVLAVFCLIYIAESVFAQSDGSWKKLPPAPTVRTEVAVALLANKIFLIGGFTLTGVTDQVVAFDLATGSWETHSPLPHPLHHTAAVVVNGKLYVIGGFTSSTWSRPTSITHTIPRHASGQ